MSTLIASCGLDCARCDAYLATQANDEAWKQRVVDQWKNEYHIEVDSVGVSCNGCVAASGPWCVHCAECPIRNCGQSRGLSTCADCPDYACEELQKFFTQVPAARANLDLLRQ